MKYVAIYTDGACKGNPGPSGFGVVVVINGTIKIQYAEYISKSTNNIAELKAVNQALTFCEYLPPTQEITIHSDSMYVINMIKDNKCKVKKNIELIGKMRCIFNRLTNVKIEHVNGHKGNKFNELADKLANNAIIAARNHRT